MVKLMSMGVKLMRMMGFCFQGSGNDQSSVASYVKPLLKLLQIATMTAVIMILMEEKTKLFTIGKSRC